MGPPPENFWMFDGKVMHSGSVCNGNLKMAITLQPFVRFTSFNFWVPALDVFYHLTPTAGPQTHYNRPYATASGLI